ncbi:MAG: crossover junction endodeoxyribonuclease RuvC [bacterium]|nr:crossover junction endodeoxyribonuclease RuvC [bacterium]
MLVLGIDPGTATTGYGLLKLNGTKVPHLLAHGWIESKDSENHTRRLNEIYEKMLVLLEKYKPDVVAMERVFFFSNAKTVIAVSQAQGVFMLAMEKNKIPLVWYTPGQVKLRIAGSGRADKKLMIQRIFDIFGLSPEPKKKTFFDDVADAVAIAYTHVKILQEEKI